MIDELMINKLTMRIKMMMWINELMVINDFFVGDKKVLLGGTCWREERRERVEDGGLAGGDEAAEEGRGGEERGRERSRLVGSLLLVGKLVMVGHLLLLLLDRLTGSISLLACCKRFSRLINPCSRSWFSFSRSSSSSSIGC